jgi:hypothetical protein
LLSPPPVLLLSPHIHVSLRNVIRHAPSRVARRSITFTADHSTVVVTVGSVIIADDLTNARALNTVRRRRCSTGSEYHRRRRRRLVYSQRTLIAIDSYGRLISTSVQFDPNPYSAARPDPSLNSSDSPTLYPSKSFDPVTADDSKNSSSNARGDDNPNDTVPAPYTAPAATAGRGNARVCYDSACAGGSAKTSACEPDTGGSKMAVMGTVHVPSRFILGSCMPGLAWLILYPSRQDA